MNEKPESSDVLLVSSRDRILLSSCHIDELQHVLYSTQNRILASEALLHRTDEEIQRYRTLHRPRRSGLTAAPEHSANGSINALQPYRFERPPFEQALDKL